MAKYLDPNATLTFRKVFCEQKDLLQSFLNAVLPLNNGNEIKSLEYIAPEVVPENPSKKYSMVDVRCTDNLNRQFIVEMQMYWTAGFLQLFETECISRIIVCEGKVSCRNNVHTYNHVDRQFRQYVNLYFP